jgi:glycerol-3-phosphate dehydrogenase
MNRTENINELQSHTYDLLVIGGGIVGAGLARDAVSRGMKVALIEKADFARGTSSRSSKLIHGGIRYLENMEFQLVFEALSEREKLYTLAPHLVHPLRFVLPIYKNSRVGMGLMGLGMWLYDILSLFQSPFHEKLSAKSSIERLPLLKQDGLMGSYVYSDAYMDDDRLTIETLRSASRLGAHVANFIEAKSWYKTNDGVHHVVAKDVLNGKDYNIKARHIASCVGPWTDTVGPMFQKNWKTQLRPTKGIHITLKKDRLKLDDAVVMAVDKENRIVFGIPRHEMIIIGTTDTDFKGAPEDVVANAEDIKYLLNIANEYFPGAQLTEKDIIASYAGVRPLVNDGSTTEGKTSREHKFLSDPSGITFIMGGKYTTYRKIAEQAMELILSDFSIEDKVRFGKNDTETPLNPLCSPDNFAKAKYLSSYWSQEFHLPLKDIEMLVSRHGMEAYEMIREGCEHKLSLWEMEIIHAIRHTMCINLVDFYTRRSPLFLAETNHGISLSGILALQMQNELGWSDEDRELQKQMLDSYIARELAWQAHQ